LSIAIRSIADTGSNISPDALMTDKNLISNTNLLLLRNTATTSSVATTRRAITYMVTHQALAVKARIIVD